jgi:hypothetical protein
MIQRLASRYRIEDNPPGTDGMIVAGRVVTKKQRRQRLAVAERQASVWRERAQRAAVEVHDLRALVHEQQDRIAELEEQLLTRRRHPSNPAGGIRQDLREAP